MLNKLTYQYYHKASSDTVYLVLHGGGPVGIETAFISAIIGSLSNGPSSVLGFNFPYCERGEEQSSGDELPEETAALDEVIAFLQSEGYARIVIIAKSLGGITTSYWLSQNQAADIELIVLGYVIGKVKTAALQGKLQLVIQGEHDRFGNAHAVQDELSKHNIEATVIEIPKADHSYRNEQNGPAYQSTAIELLVQQLNPSR